MRKLVQKLIEDPHLCLLFTKHYPLMSNPLQFVRQVLEITVKVRQLDDAFKTTFYKIYTKCFSNSPYLPKESLQAFEFSASNGRSSEDLLKMIKPLFWGK